jgi:YbbR domain-containing protein
LLSNLRIKLLAIALATAFWGVVSYTQNPTQTRSVRLTVDHPALPPGLTVIGDIPQVSVTVIGTAENLRLFDPRALHLSANFSGVRVGSNRVPIHVDNADPDVSLTQPDSMTVDVDEIATAVETVVIERRNSLPPGFHEVTSATTISPTTIQVAGPKTLLTGSQAVVVVDLDGVVAPFNQAINVAIRDAKKLPLTKMIVTPPQVSVKMTIQADAVTLTKTAGFTITGQPASGYRVTNATVTPVTVNVTGLSAVLAGLAQVASDPVDITNATTDVVRTVRLRPPAGVDVSPTTVQVHVFIGKIPGTSPSP